MSYLTRGKELVSSRGRCAGPRGMPHISRGCVTAVRTAPQWTNGRSRFLEGTSWTGADPTWIRKTPSRYSGFHACPRSTFDIQIRRRFSAIARIANHLWRFWALSVVAVALSKRRNAESFVRWKRVWTLSPADKEFFWSTDDEQEIDATYVTIFRSALCFTGWVQTSMWWRFG